MTTNMTPVVPVLSVSGAEQASAPPNDSILYQISFTYLELTAAFERHMGMSRARWAILSRLGRVDNLTQSVLAEILHVDAAAITRQVKQLESEGLVTRWSAPEDNRFTVVALTEKGRAFVQAQRSVRDEFERIVTQGLSEAEIEQTRRSLLIMRRNLDVLPTEQ